MGRAIRLAPNSHPVGLAVDGAHVYWASLEAPDAICRANLDGTGVEPGFVTGASDPVGVAVDGGHRAGNRSRAARGKFRIRRR
jgi:hypothetical protein